MQVADESGRHLPRPRVGSAGDCAKNNVGDVVDLFDDAIGRLFLNLAARARQSVATAARSSGLRQLNRVMEKCSSVQWNRV
jgi:hypothetical protein